MRTDLDHLPPAKQRELELIRRILFEEFEDAIRLGTQPWKRQGRILKIILFGSYARGDWVNDPVGGYISDYDLLVIVNHEKLTDTLDYWAKADDHLLREYSVTHHLTAPANFIVHSLADVNEQLARGRPFFVDIVRDGIALYELDGHELQPSKPLSAEAQRNEARQYFERWFQMARRSIQTFKLQQAEGDDDYWRNKQAFELHQAVEQLYHCVLLTLTLYSPKSHKLSFLRSQAEGHDARLLEAWPRSTKLERRCFDLLRRAYVEARYSPHYEITPEELAWISERIAVLQELVRTTCEERIESLQRSAAE